MTQKDKEAFIALIAGYALEYAPLYNIAVVSPIVAQAILESGWGRSKLAKEYYNYFGMKTGSRWNGPSINLTTKEEYTPGIPVSIRDYFRVYNSAAEGVKGYFEFLQLDRYKGLKGETDPQEYVKKLKEAGYATSGTYVSDVMRIIEVYNLTEIDKKLTNGGGSYMARFKTEAEAVDTLIATAEAEVGYLEKKTAEKLDSKTANAGSNNITKYWRDIKPAFQGQYWCACFVSWCFMVAFGREAAEKLLKHWPFVYCPALAAKAGAVKTPKRGAVILFWKPSLNRYGHTGIVWKVTENYIYTIEGNTSGASGVVSNGGGVVSKKYKRAELHSKTLYYWPPYSSVVVVGNNNKEEKKKDNPEQYIVGDCTVTLKSFVPGAEHKQIKAVQRILNALGYKGENGKALTVDGVLGTQTVKALKDFQAAEKLDINTPGTIAGKTWTALLNK